MTVAAAPAPDASSQGIGMFNMPIPVFFRLNFLA
jgi:hypothetical protein